MKDALRTVDDYRRWLGSHEFPQVARVLDNLYAELNGEGLNAGTPGKDDNCVISSLRDQLRKMAEPIEFLTVTTTEEGEAVLVSWQDEEHRILRVVWERAAAVEPAAQAEGEASTGAKTEGGKLYEIDRQLREQHQRALAAQPPAPQAEPRLWLKCDACGKDMRGHTKMGHCIPSEAAAVEPAAQSEPCRGDIDRCARKECRYSCTEAATVEPVDERVATLIDALAKSEATRIFDAARLDFLDQNARFKMGWEVVQAPAGNLSVRSVIQLAKPPTPIRDAIDAANKTAFAAQPPAPQAAAEPIDLQSLADKVVISNATGNEKLFLNAVRDLLGGVRALATKQTPAPAPQAKPCTACTGRGEIGGVMQDGSYETLDCSYCQGTGNEPPAPQAAPAGWKLVPIEPTTEMMEADWNVTMSDAHTEGGVGRCAWAAMLAASPDFPATPGALTSEAE